MPAADGRKPGIGWGRGSRESVFGGRFVERLDDEDIEGQLFGNEQQPKLLDRGGEHTGRGGSPPEAAVPGRALLYSRWKSYFPASPVLSTIRVSSAGRRDCTSVDMPCLCAETRATRKPSAVE